MRQPRADANTGTAHCDECANCNQTTNSDCCSANRGIYSSSNRDTCSAYSDTSVQPPSGQFSQWTSQITDRIGREK